MSGFALADPGDVRRGIERLSNDLKSGKWDETYSDLRRQLNFDAGYRFLKFASGQETRGSVIQGFTLSQV
jgi:hypothetical protein